jgi:hypothetical protein
MGEKFSLARQQAADKRLEELKAEQRKLNQDAVHAEQRSRARINYKPSERQRRIVGGTIELEVE